MTHAIIDWCVRNRFLVILLTLMVAAVGILAMYNIPVDAIPDLSDVQVIVYSQWMGRDPETIEDQVTYPLTTKMLAVPGSKVARGYSFFGFSLVYVIFEDGTDIYWARSRVLEYLSDIQGRLPEGVTTSIGPDATGVGWVYEYTLENGPYCPTHPEQIVEGETCPIDGEKTIRSQFDLGELRALQDWYLRYPLTSVEGVSEVASVGGFERQFQITVDPNKLLTYNIPLRKILMAVKRSNNDVGGRLLEISETEYMVRGRGYVKAVTDLEKVVIGVSKQGTPILLRDVATIAIGPDIRRGLAEKNGEGQVVAGIIVMRYGENALKVIERVKKKIADLQKGLPPGVRIHTAYDRSALIHRSIDTLKMQLIEEMVIVALVCILFLWHTRSALVAAVTLPLGILISFIAMHLIGVNANIMSLGGIAIAIGAMVDAAVVLVENFHKHKERGEKTDHWKLVAEASREVGPGLFFSLLIITVSFLPVFALQAQAGRLFKPLAYTKTFAMAAAAVIAITVIPVAMGFFVRGKIHPETRNPLNRFLMWLYVPAIRLVLKYKTASILLAVALLLVSTVPMRSLGSEFMPPLNEGDILYMPTSIPGISITEAQRTLQIQDKLFKQFPEVDVVLGKIGRAETPTDPAPLTMVETTVTLKPPHEWPERKIVEGQIARLVRPHTDSAEEVEKMALKRFNQKIRLAIVQGRPAREGLQGFTDFLRKHAKGAPEIDPARIRLRRVRDIDELMYKEMDPVFQFPGLTNAWTMPIKTRIDMLATGIKTPIGIKVFGPDLATLEKLAIRIEEVVKRDAGTLSAIAERVFGGNYIDFEIDRDACARHGLNVGDVQDVIETAIGGMNLTQTVEGPYRFSVNVRYPREMRDDPVRLGRVLVPTPLGEQIPIGQLAKIEIKEGPPAIKSENAMRQAVVYVDLNEGQDVGTYIGRVRGAVERDVPMPPGYHLAWSGQFQYMQEANRRLLFIVPITLATIFLLLYFNMGNLGETLITMVTLPFALIGGVWYLYILGYNMSVAVAIGFIALAGLAAETAVVMHVYLDIYYRKKKPKDRPMSEEELNDAIEEGAALRVRPKMMTVFTTILALLPIMWAVGAGAGPMKRMAAPMIGGLVSSTIHTLLLIPVYYALHKKFVHWLERRRRNGRETPGEPDVR